MITPICIVIYDTKAFDEKKQINQAPTALVKILAKKNELNLYQGATAIIIRQARFNNIL